MTQKNFSEGCPQVFTSVTTISPPWEIVHVFKRVRLECGVLVGCPWACCEVGTKNVKLWQAYQECEKASVHGHTLCVNGAEVGVFKDTNEVSL